MKRTALLLLLSVPFLPALALLPSCGGSGKTGKKPGRAPITTRAALERRLSRLGTAPMEGSEFAGATPVSGGGWRFEYDLPFEDNSTYENAKDYYGGTFRAALLEAGFVESPLSTDLKRIYTGEGETISVQVSLPSAAAVTRKLPVFISYKVNR